MRAIPALFRGRVRSRIYRYYGALIAIERDALRHTSEDERRQFIDEIERSLNTLRMPLAFADAFHVLRDHIRFVCAHLVCKETVPS